MDGTTPETPAPMKPAAEMSLADHELASRARYAKLCSKLKKLKENTMSGTPDVNVYSKGPTDSVLPLLMGGGGWGGAGAGAGAGLGAGLVGGLLGGLLFNRNGFGGGFGGDGFVGGPRAAAALDGTDGMAIIAAISGVKDSVAGSTASVLAAINMGDMSLSNMIQSGFAMQSTNTLQQTIMLTQQANTNQVLLNQAINNVNENVSAQGCMTREAIGNDGDKTRALIVAQYEATLNRIITTQANEITELKGDRNAFRTDRGVEVTVQQSVAVAQQQQQQQQVVNTLGVLCQAIQGLQVATATNANLIIGNTGATTTGPQTANPVNVRA